MATYNADKNSRARLRPASIASYNSNLSYESYSSTISSASASSTFVNARSIYSVSDVHTETDESVGSSIDVQRPDSPSNYDYDPDQEVPGFHVFCIHDFDSDDPDHTSFNKSDILKIIAQEPSGWWAAQSGDHVGWIPSAFVEPIAPELVQKLLDTPHDMRWYEYEAEKLYSGLVLPGSEGTDGSTPSMDDSLLDDDDTAQFLPTPSDLLSPRGFPTDVTPVFSGFPSLASPGSEYLTEPWPGVRQSVSPNVPRTPRTPRTPIPPKVPAPAPSTTKSAIPQPQVSSRPPPPQLTLNTTTAPLNMNINKPTPPTPVLATPLPNVPTSSKYAPSPMLPRSRSLGSSSTSLVSSASSSSRRRPDGVLYSPGSVRNLSTLIESPRVFTDSPAEASFMSPNGSPYSSKNASGRGKIWQITGDDNAQAFHNAKMAQAQQPWYLKPDHTGNEIKVEYDGSVKAGTLEALVERLTIEPLKVEHEKTFRHTFLTTFRTFTTADRALELLIERFGMRAPNEITEEVEQYNEWIEKKLLPTQARVLHVFSQWVEQYGVIEDDPQIIPQLRDFLGAIVSPTPQAQNAKNILQAIDRQRHLDINIPSLAPSGPVRKATKRHKNDLLKIDHGDLARQLTLYEARLYLKLRPHECLAWSSNQKGNNVPNLRAFVSTSDKLAAWVKMSILNNDALGKRADTIELWIKVAEKCRNMNNFSSMSAIIAALTSQVIARLQLTWAHVSRASHVEPLVKLSEPTSNFAAYRNIFSTAEGPCLPYIGIYLSDMVKVSETFPDVIKTQSSDSNNLPNDLRLINFTKRQKMGEVANSILRHQPKVREQYKITEITSILEFVEAQLRTAAGKDEGSFWMRSQEVQTAELAHADIRKGLEAAGF